MGYGLAPCEGFSKDKLPMDYLTPEKLFKFIDYTMS